jgi:hypothetical protein
MGSENGGVGMNAYEMIGFFWVVLTVGIGSALILISGAFGLIGLWNAANRGIDALGQQVASKETDLSLRTLLGLRRAR